MRDGDSPIFLPLVSIGIVVCADQKVKDCKLSEFWRTSSGLEVFDIAVYLVAQYARHEMKKMDAQLEKMKIEEATKVKAAEEDVIKSNPQLLEVKERLDSLEKTVKEMVTESKTQRSIKVSE
ncbi:hypothetical protein Tco_0381474 [Tanacetum coccineum]